jgi:hypothetical protein
MYVSFSTQNWYINVMAEEHGSQSSQKAETISINKKTLKRYLAFLFVLIILTGACFIFFRKDKNDKLNDTAALKDASQQVNFPVYYAQPLPAYKVNSNSVGTTNGILTYSYTYGNDVINVAEQPNPSVVEQVTKTRKFDTPIGSAYLADLNGHTAGFIQSDKTLIILSSQNNIGDKLQTLMSNFKKL